jgi:hypothetical protein
MDLLLSPLENFRVAQPKNLIFSSGLTVAKTEWVPDVQASINGPQHLGTDGEKITRLTYRRKLPKASFLGRESLKKTEPPW